MKKHSRNMLNKKNISFILIIIFFGGFFLFKLIFNISEDSYTPIKAIAQHSNGDYFSGSTSCAECHPEIYESHLETAHYNSSAIASNDNVKGSFEGHENIFDLSDSIEFRMNDRNNTLYQDIFQKSKNSLIDSSRFDVVIGSGTKGQTYLTWQDSALFQLQISYFAPTDSWINSPGYRSNKLASRRPIFGRCLECHATYAKSTQNFNRRNIYTKSKIIYRIDCERCHGPSLEHVNFHRKYPADTIAKKILSFRNLGRQQKLDACALCHSGIRARSNQNAFAFIAGDTLKHYSMPGYDEKNVEKLDVHGNQYGLLLASKCFKKSKTMDCMSCHNTHKKERNNYALFNNRCQNCHNTSNYDHINCSASEKAKGLVDNNCVQCHMPLVSSKVMQIEMSKDTLKSVEVRTHFIGIYSDSLLLSN